MKQRNDDTDEILTKQTTKFIVKKLFSYYFIPILFS